MSIVYREEDGNLDHLAGKLIGVIGYGNLGRPIALNLRDSGIDVLVSDRDSVRQTLAAQEGFAVASTAELVRRADVIMLLVPDEVMPQLYLTEISPHLERGDTLIFASSYNVALATSKRRHSSMWG